MKRHDHYWLYTGFPHSLVYVNHRWRYDCSVCGKQIWRRDSPVNPIVPSAWDVYNKEVAADNAHLVMTPTLMIGSSEPEYITGRRYKRLVQGREDV